MDAAVEQLQQHAQVELNPADSSLDCQLEGPCAQTISEEGFGYLWSGADICAYGYTQRKHVWPAHCTCAWLVLRHMSCQCCVFLRRSVTTSNSLQTDQPTVYMNSTEKRAASAVTLVQQQFVLEVRQSKHTPHISSNHQPRHAGTVSAGHRICPLTPGLLLARSCTHTFPNK